MITLPKKYSIKWILIIVALFILSFVSMFLGTSILALSASLENIGGFAILSLIVSLTIGIGGLIGAKSYFKIALTANIIGIIYMLVISALNTAEGWSDLVSIISYLFILSIGIVLGMVYQLILILINHYKKRRNEK